MFNNEWIPIVRREPTATEKKSNFLLQCVYECEMPKDGQLVILCNTKGDIWITTVGELPCGLGTYIEHEHSKELENGMAWMSAPEPYKKWN